ncbi:MAG: zinc-dependent metalloprotease family protein [Bacteroidota bacterium]
MKKLASGLLLAIILLALSFPTFAQSQLIGEELDPVTYNLDVSADDAKVEIIRKRYVSLKDWDMGSQLRLDLFPDIDILSYIEDIEIYGKRKTWKGRIAGSDFAYVLISEQEGIYFGKIVTPDLRSFQLQYKGEPVYGIYEVDPTNIVQDENDQVILETEDLIEGDNGICEASYSCSAVEIDILVVYTPAAKAGMGNSTSAIEAAIAGAITEMNAVNSNSGVPHTYNLVHVEEINFTESGTSGADLASLRNQNDGVMDNVHQLRFIHRADLVALVTSSIYCGVAYVQPNPTYFYADIGFSVTGLACMNTNLTFAHEVGHNMGLHHDWFVNTSPNPCRHHHGYVNQNAPAGFSHRWRTVMAYNNNCSNTFGFSCRRLPYWSNPDINMTGDPMGVPIGNSQPSNSAFALRRSSCLIAGLSNQLVPFPVVYQDWQAKTEGSEIVLNWSTSQEINNSGFEIEIRSESSEEFNKLAFVPGKGNSTESQSYSFNIKHSFPGIHYIRLKQIDYDGTFEYSSTKEVEIESEEQIYHQVFPNPSKEISNLEFLLYRSSEYKIDLMDIKGNLIRNLYNGKLNAGKHQFELYTKDLTPGLYFYSIRSLIDQEMGKLWIL